MTSFNQQIDPENLRSARARSLQRYLADGGPIGAKYVACSEDGNRQFVIADVLVEVGQLPAIDIRRTERVAFEFADADDKWPWIWALREDFPQALPHTNLMSFGDPPCLCIAVEPFQEMRRRLTSESLVGRVRHWFAATANGTLHPDDQVLEPFLSASATSLILPIDLKNAPDGLVETFTVQPCDGTHYRVTARRDGQPLAMSIVTLTMPARTHGRIQRMPNNLAQLAELTDGEGFGLVKSLREVLAKINGSVAGTQVETVTLLLRTPMKRRPEDDPNDVSVHAFFLARIDEVAQELGVWQVISGRRGALIGAEARPDRVPLQQFNIEYELEPEEASMLNGIECRNYSYLAIGAGALGSQVLMNLARGGIRPKAIVEKDYLSPHNLARHALAGSWIGFNKGRALANEIDSLFGDHHATTALQQDFVSPNNGTMRTAMKDVDYILDLSASQGVAATLATSAEYPRSTSAFMNPTGTDLIILSEDASRHTTLDALESQYLWAVTEEDRLKNHFQKPTYRRYATGCADRSFVIPQSTVGLFAGIVASAVVCAWSTNKPSAAVWQLQDDLSVKRIDIAVRPVTILSAAGWQCVISGAALDNAKQLRTDALPNETGGIMMGSVDLIAKRIYVAGLLRAPIDSVATPVSFIRGTVGVETELSRRGELVDSQLYYVGEWHSHPDNRAAVASPTDVRAYDTLSERMRQAGYPETMLVVGPKAVSCIVSGAQSPEAAA